jgi:hypothetical protein
LVLLPVKHGRFDHKNRSVLPGDPTKKPHQIDAAFYFI